MRFSGAETLDSADVGMQATEDCFEAENEEPGSHLRRSHRGHRRPQFGIRVEDDDDVDGSGSEDEGPGRVRRRGGRG